MTAGDGQCSIPRNCKYPDPQIIYKHKGRPILNNTIMFSTWCGQHPSKPLKQTPSASGKDPRHRVLLRHLQTHAGREVQEWSLPPIHHLPGSPYAELHAQGYENIWKFPASRLEVTPAAFIPGNAGAHIMGYIGEADSNIIKRSRRLLPHGQHSV